MLALKWSVCDKFSDYLLGSKFVVETDNNPLTYVLTTAKLDATGHRWISELSMYNFEIKYRPGKSNAVTDSLSRMYSGESKSVDKDTIQALFIVVCMNGLVACVTVSSATFPAEEVDAIQMVSHEEMRAAQRNKSKWLWRERSHLEIKDGI